MDIPLSPPVLARETILKALARLDEKLRGEGIIGEICLYGGTAMVLAFNARLSTRDVDAVFKPPEMIRRHTAEIGEEFHLPPNWLNDGVKGFLSHAGEYTSDGLPQWENLRAIRPTAEYLLAMKCMASRSPSYETSGDREDILFLIRQLRLADSESVLQVVEKFYPADRIPPKTHFLIQELVQG
ncbi:MAG TPA: hypothetical protein VHY22_05290 [Chthoniobacteraceae bacterium]|jgi:hypothetical protein|nr:hypothetical protein [Chthoniobacteraceae bacterium]